jgi:phosphoribosylformylglycinamidine cyclo-ligase
MMEPKSYAAAGVNIELAESFVRRLKSAAKRHGHEELWPAGGSYACVYPVSEHMGVALTTDGIGTKLLVSIELGVYDTIGIDLVAMCANDLICVGALPNLFLDYFAVGRLDAGVADKIINGIIAGCDLAGMILAGGETAEMPDVYAPGHFDLAGFAVGYVSRDRLITGQEVRPGQKVIGVAASGIHSNGFSLARQVLDQAHWRLLLEPTHIYVKAVNHLLDAHRQSITALAHITGGGWRNLLRLNPSVGFEISQPLPVPHVFELIAAHVSEEEMYKTFNMGLGLAVIVDGDETNTLRTFQTLGFEAAVIGVTTEEAKKVRIAGKNFVLHH